MNNAETLAVLKMIQAALPGAYIDERTPDVWVNVCADVKPDVGLDAAKRLIGSWTERRFPAPADFMAHVRAAGRAREPARLPAAGETDPPLPREAGLAEVARARELLASRRRRPVS